VTTGAIRFQAVFVIFDEQFGVAPVPNLFIKILRSGLFERGSDVSGVKFAAVIDVYLAHNPAETSPGSAGVITGGIDPAYFPQSFVFELGLAEGKLKLPVE